MTTFAVLLENYQPPPPEKLSILYQAVCGMPKLDANLKATRARGILAESLSYEVAGKFKLALGNLGFPARVVAQEGLPETTKSRRVQFVQAAPGAFVVRWTITGMPQNYAWHEVLVISAGVVFHKQEEQVLKQEENWGTGWTGHPAFRTTTEVTKRDTSRDMAMATITLRSVSGLEHLRLRAQELNYAAILGDANLRPSPLQNFCVVLARIGNLATHAEITEETIQLIAAANATPRLPREPKFESDEEFDLYQRWLVAKRLTNG